MTSSEEFTSFRHLSPANLAGSRSTIGASDSVPAFESYEKGEAIIADGADFSG